MTRVALATCAELPELDEDDAPLVAALAARDVEAVPAVWDDPAVDWTAFDLVVLRSTWDYAERRDAFLAWGRTLPHVANPVSVLEWNTDKERYLTDLQTAEVPIVPTRFIERGDALDLPGGRFVVKPSISAGGRRSARFAPDEHDAAAGLVARIHDEGRVAMVQPLVDDVDETALVYIEGAFSHALRRRVPLPPRQERAVLYLDEQLAPATAAPDELDIGAAAMACAPGSLLYGRVDLIGGMVLELELAEPSLYLAFGDGAVDRLARAVASRIAPVR